MILIPRPTGNPAGAWSFTAASVNADSNLDGVTQSIAVYGIDLIGNRSTDPLMLDVIVDNVGPALAVTQLVFNKVYTPAIPAPIGTASDSDVVESVLVRVESPNGATYLEPVALDGSDWSYALRPDAIGRYRLSVLAYDRPATRAWPGRSRST